MDQFIPLYLNDYLIKTLIKIKVATDESNRRNEIWHWKNNEIGVALQSSVWVQVEFMAW